MLSPKQKMAIAQSNAKINLWSGAVRSGKSFSATLRFLIEAAEAPPGDFAICTRDQNAFRRNVLPILRDLVGGDVVYRSGISQVELWGRKIHLIGASDQRAESKLRGCTLQAALVDEASVLPESFWIVLLQRTAMNGGRVFATTNPDSSGHWLKTNFIDDNEDVITFYFTLDDNPLLKEEDKNFLRRQHHGVYYKRFIAGEWCMAEGAIFPFFDEQIHTIARAPGPAKYYIAGADIGFSNATGFVLVGFNDELSPALWVESEYYHSAKKSPGKTDTDYCRDLYEFVNQRPNVTNLYIDPSAAAFKMECRRHDMGVHLVDANNSVLDGIRSLSSLIANGDLKVMRSCRHLIGELQSYSWDEAAAKRGEDAPHKVNDHLTDGLRYCIYTHFGKKLFLKPAVNQTDNSSAGWGGNYSNKYMNYVPSIRKQ